MPEIRCLKCNKLLFKGQFIEIEVKCPRCGHLSKMSAPERQPKSKAHAKTNNRQCHTILR
ncbi:Com family DNA-binding transcriptional regulator [Rahnella contaminans]|uniref:Com family DNA-binding transcriptional regulator n=1 Tax=Rahnella contaminans TaxID=2703882 RepID=UPI003C2C30A7